MSESVDFASRTQNPRMPDIWDIDPAELRDKMTEVALIDVRRPDEYVGELGHIAGTHLITLDTLPQKLEQLPKNQTIVFICRSGQRSAQAAAFVRQHGYNSVFNMAGGMILWNDMGFEIER